MGNTVQIISPINIATQGFIGIIPLSIATRGFIVFLDVEDVIQAISPFKFPGIVFSRPRWTIIRRDPLQPLEQT